MAVYPITWVDLNGVYDGLGLFSVKSISVPAQQVQNININSGAAPGTDPPLTGTFGSSNTAGNCIFLWIIGLANSGIFVPNSWTITDTNGNVYNLVQAQATGGGGNDQYNRLYVAENIVGGANTITVTWTMPSGSTKVRLNIFAEEWTNVPTSGVITQNTQTINRDGHNTNSLSITESLYPLQVIGYISGNYTLTDDIATSPTFAIGTGGNNPNGNSTKVFLLLPVLTCGNPPGGTVGVPYTAQLSLVGGFGPFVLNISSGALPPGLSFDTTNGKITGTPTNTGTYTFSAHVIDADGNTSDTPSLCSITITADLSIACGNPPSATVGDAYDHFFVATGGSGSYVSYVKLTGTLPTGLTLNPTTGELTGQVTAAGTFVYKIQVTDSLGAMADTGDCSTVVSAGSGLTAACNNPPDGTVGLVYAHAITASSGTPPYAYALAFGTTLPPGLALAADGNITGTPTTAGLYPFSVTVTDNVAATNTVNCSITILSGRPFGLYLYGVKRRKIIA